MNMAIQNIDNPLTERTVCEILDLNRNTFRQHRKASEFCGPPAPPRTSRKHCVQPNALSHAERQHVLSVLNEPQHCDQPPMQVYHALLQQGHYICSQSTMQRILRAAQQNGERRNQRAPQHYEVPRLEARAVNQVWSWDITKLPTLQRGVYLNLYVVMDLYSRYVVAWMLSRKENSALAGHLIEQAHHRHGIEPNQLTLHQDRGAPMTAHCYLDLLGELSIAASYSRPRVSNDNAVSEAQFKTLKYQPDYPRRFEGHGHAQRWCEDYFTWYNTQHHHSGLNGYTPEQVFTGRYHELHRQRQTALDIAYLKHPQRFRNGAPQAKLPPEVMFINPVIEVDENPVAESVSTPGANII